MLDAVGVDSAIWRLTFEDSTKHRATIFLIQPFDGRIQQLSVVQVMLVVMT